MLTQQFINDVLSINKTVENHVMWFRETVDWIKDNHV